MIRFASRPRRALALGLIVSVPGAVAGEVVIEDEVHSGIYSSNSDPASTPEAVAQATGRRTSLAGMFIEPGTAGRPRPDEVWRWETTPFANVS